MVFVSEVKLNLTDSASQYIVNMQCQNTFPKQRLKIVKFERTHWWVKFWARYWETHNKPDEDTFYG